MQPFGNRPAHNSGSGYRSGPSDSTPRDPFATPNDPFRRNSASAPSDPFAPLPSSAPNSNPFGNPSANSPFRSHDPPSFAPDPFSPADNSFPQRHEASFTRDPFASQNANPPPNTRGDPFNTAPRDPFNRSPPRYDTSRHDPFNKSTQDDAFASTAKDPFAPASNQTWDTRNHFPAGSSSNAGASDFGNPATHNDPFAPPASNSRAAPGDRPPRVLAKAVLVRGVPPLLFSEGVIMKHFGAIPGVTPLRVTMRGSLRGPDSRRTAMVSFATPQEASIAMSRGRHFEGEQLTMSYFRGTSTGGDRMDMQRAPPQPVPESRELLFSYVPVELFSEDAVRHLFNSISRNSVVSVSIRSRPHRGSVKRTAIITFGHVEAARTALHSLPLFNGEKLQVSYRTRPPHADGQSNDAGEGANSNWNDAGQGARWQAPSPMPESHSMNDASVDTDQVPFEVHEEEMGEVGNGNSHAASHPERETRRDGPARGVRGWESNGGRGGQGTAEEKRLSEIERLKKDIAEKERELQRRRTAKSNRNNRNMRSESGRRQPPQPRISEDLARSRASKTVVRKPTDTGEGWRKSEQIDIKDAVQLVGTCQTMCPAKEIEERILQRDISVFETVSGKGSDPDPAKAVKKYRRSAAISEEPTPEDIRPPPVLLKTMEHLKAVCDTEGESFTEIHKFVRDRTRSLRQDFTYQGVRDDTCIKVHEESVRFHILSEHRLAGSDPAVFSSKQNLEQLDKCLISLREMYDLRREENLPTSPNEPEMQAYYLLLQMSGPQTCVRLLRGFSPDVRNSLPIQLALQVVKSCSRSFWDYIGFFKCLRAAPYLLACMMYTRSHHMRCQALRIINSSHGARDIINVSKLTEQLCFDGDEETVKFCSIAGFGIRNVESRGADAPVKAVSMTSRLDPDKWDELFPKGPSALVENKSGRCKPSELIAGSLNDIYNLTSLPHDCSPRLRAYATGTHVQQHSPNLQRKAPRSSTLAPPPASLALIKPVTTALSKKTPTPVKEDLTANRSASSILSRLGSAPSNISQGSKEVLEAEKRDPSSSYGEPVNLIFLAASQPSLGSSTGQAASWNPTTPGADPNESALQETRDLEQAPQIPGATINSKDVGTTEDKSKRVSSGLPISESENFQSSQPSANIFGSTVPMPMQGMPSAKPVHSTLSTRPDNSALEECKRAKAEADRKAKLRAEMAEKAAREAEQQRRLKKEEEVRKSFYMERERKIAEARAQLMEEKEAVAAHGAFIKLVREVLKEMESMRRRLERVDQRFTSISKEIEVRCISTFSDTIMDECRQAQTTMEVVSFEIRTHFSHLNDCDPKTEATQELKKNVSNELDKLIDFGRKVWKKVWEIKGVVIATPKNFPQRKPPKSDGGGGSLKRNFSEARLHAKSGEEDGRTHGERLEEAENGSEVKRIRAESDIPLLKHVTSLMKEHRVIRMQIAVTQQTTGESHPTRRTQDWVWRQFRSNSFGETVSVCTESPGQIPCFLSVRRFDGTRVPPTANVIICSLDLSSCTQFERQCEWIKNSLAGQDQSKLSDKKILPVMILLLCIDSSAEVSTEYTVRPQEAKAFGEGLAHQGLVAGSVPVHIPTKTARSGHLSEQLRAALKASVKMAATESTRLSLFLHFTIVGDRAVHVGNSAWIRYLSKYNPSAGRMNSHLEVIDSINLAWTGLGELLGEEQERWPEEMTAQVQRMKEVRLGLRRKLRLPLPAEIGAKNSCEYFKRLVALSNVCVPTPSMDWMTLAQFCRALGHLMTPLVAHLLGDMYGMLVYLPKSESNESGNLIGLRRSAFNLDAKDITPPVVVDRTWDGRVIGTEPVALRTANKPEGGWAQRRQQSLPGMRFNDIGTQRNQAGTTRERVSLENLRENLVFTPNARQRRLSVPSTGLGRRDDSDFLAELCETEETHQALLDETIDMLRQEQARLAAETSPRPESESTSK